MASRQACETWLYVSVDIPQVIGEASDELLWDAVPVPDRWDGPIPIGIAEHSLELSDDRRGPIISPLVTSLLGARRNRRQVSGGLIQIRQ